MGRPEFFRADQRTGSYPIYELQKNGRRVEPGAGPSKYQVKTDMSAVPSALLAIPQCTICNHSGSSLMHFPGKHLLGLDNENLYGSSEKHHP